MTPLKYLLTFSILSLLFTPAISQKKNQGVSNSLGEHHQGALKNAYRLPRKGDNFKYFSRFSYYLLGCAHVNSNVYTTVINTYEDLEQKYPKRQFRIMECSKKKGGKMLLHRTHQNGLSIDFMTPLLKKNKKGKQYDGLGIFRYLLNFKVDGVLRSNKNISIDFNTMAEHILLLEKNTRVNGLKIKKIIFKIELKDDLFKTEAGKKLKASGIYFAQNLTPILNKVHDDHYHVDFEIL